MTISIALIETDFDINDLSNDSWLTAEKTTMDRYWSGENAPLGRHFSVRLLWSQTALYGRFDSNRSEPLVISDRPDLTQKTIGLWDRDVCEIFLAPNADEPRRYFEFEVAPTGEWVDLAIDFTSGARVTDWDFVSGMTAAARVDEDCVVMAIKVPWKALGKVPRSGDVWLGNLFRCVGAGPDRGYLTWKPTLTPEPAFHVPEVFGRFLFTD